LITNEKGYIFQKQTEGVYNVHKSALLGGTLISITHSETDSRDGKAHTQVFSFKNTPFELRKNQSRVAFYVIMTMFLLFWQDDDLSETEDLEPLFDYRRVQHHVISLDGESLCLLINLWLSLFVWLPEDPNLIHKFEALLIFHFFKTTFFFLLENW